MSFARRFGIAAGCAVFLGIAALGWLRWAGQTESVTHEGRTAEEWLYAYFHSASPADFVTNYFALKSLREQSIPILAERCVDSARPKPLGAFFQKLRRQIPLANAGPDDHTLNALSGFALKTFDPSAREILPKAERLFTRSLLKGGKNKALSMLQFSVGDPTPCVPLLARAFRDGDAEVGEVAAEVALDLYQSKPPHLDLLEPLVQHLTRATGSYTAVDHSYLLLAEFGPAASNAVPMIRKRFESETNLYPKANFGGALIRIDPTTTDVLNLLTDWTLSTNEALRSAGHFQLAMAGPAAAPVSERLWAALDSSPSPHQLEDLLVRIVAPYPLKEGFVPREDALVRKLLDRFRRHLFDPDRNEPQDDRLNPAWRILRLDPSDARAWEVFRGILMSETVSDPAGGQALRASTAMDYLLSIPVPVTDKQRLLRETMQFYPGTTSFQRLLRETAQKHLIHLDPSERPSDLNELIDLYFD